MTTMQETDHPDESDFNVEVVLGSGSKVTLRAIRSDDGDRFAAMVERCSESTLYYRFLVPQPPEMPEKEIQYFTNVDHDRRMAIVALMGDDDNERIVAEGRWDVLTDDPSTAEVAFLVEDAHQGEGLGTVLLTELTTLAPKHGITTFDATTLAENRAMLDVFNKMGYRVTHETEAGLYHIVFPIHATPESREAALERQRHARAAAVASALEPSRIAIIDSNNDARSIGSQMLRNVVHGGFTGVAFPVNPSAASVASIPTYRSVQDMPDDIDLVVLTGERDDVVQILGAVGERGVRMALVVTDFTRGDGDRVGDFENELVEACRPSGIRMIGAASVGVVNTDPRVRLDLIAGHDRPKPGVVAVATQTGALGVGLLSHLKEADIGISQFVSLGDRADIDSSDMLAYWDGQTATRVILLYIEDLRNGAGFARLARSVGRRTPIAAVLPGARDSEPGTKALDSQCGVIRADTFDDLVDVAALTSTQPLPQGPRVAIVTNSDGAGRLVADACLGAGLVLDKATATVESDTPDGDPAANPVCIPYQPGSSGKFEQALRGVAADPDYDAVLVIYVPIGESDAEEVGAELIRASLRARSKTFAASFFGAPNVPRFLRRRGLAVPVFTYPESAARAIGHAARYAAWRCKDAGKLVEFDDIDLDAVSASVAKCDSGLATAEQAANILGTIGITLVGAVGDTFVIRVRRDTRFGCLLGLAYGTDANDIDGDAYRFVPLTDVDARMLLEHVLDTGGSGDTVSINALAELILRIGVLANSQERIRTADLIVQAGDLADVTSASFAMT